MDQTEKDWLKAEFRNINTTIKTELKHVTDRLDTVDEDIHSLENKVNGHSTKLTVLNEFKEGHQRFHNSHINGRRFQWEMILIAAALFLDLVKGLFVKEIGG